MYVASIMHGYAQELGGEERWDEVRGEGGMEDCGGGYGCGQDVGRMWKGRERGGWLVGRRWE